MIMTTSNRQITTLAQLIEQVDNHTDKDELIQLINEQVIDDTYQIKRVSGEPYLNNTSRHNRY